MSWIWRISTLKRDDVGFIHGNVVWICHVRVILWNVMCLFQTLMSESISGNRKLELLSLAWSRYLGVTRHGIVVICPPTIRLGLKVKNMLWKRGLIFCFKQMFDHSWNILIAIFILNEHHFLSLLWEFAIFAYLISLGWRRNIFYLLYGDQNVILIFSSVLGSCFNWLIFLV